jgi:hypothetical protein
MQNKNIHKISTTIEVPSIIQLVSHPVMIYYSVASQISPSTALLLFWVGKLDETGSPVKYSN